MFTDRDRKKCDQLYDRYYSGRKFSRTLYQELIRKYVAPGHRLLDAGCGRHLEFSREFSEDVTVVGVDLEEYLNTDNGRSPYAIRGDLDRLPFSSEAFDLVISRSVVEHLAHPDQVFREFHRILKPGGRVILSTPNKYDYISIFASLSPYRWHRSIVSRVVGVSADDVFPTLYRANTRSALAREMKAAGLVKKELGVINHYPVYLMFSPVLFRLGVLYERVTSLRPFESLRGTILGVFEKPGAGSPGSHAFTLRPEEVGLTSRG